MIQPRDPVYSYLVALGYSERKIAGWSMETRLYQDLNLWGLARTRNKRQLTADQVGLGSIATVWPA